jgi:hypothetical protein
MRVRCIGPGRLKSLDDRAERGTQPLHGGPQVAKQGLDCLGIPNDQPGEECRARRGDPGADPLQAVSGRLDEVRGGAQRAAQDLLVVMFALTHHASRSSTLRNADMARAVWLLTAPLLMPIIEAI